MITIPTAHEGARDTPRFRRLIAVFLFGFSSGLPYGLVSSSLQAWYAVSHLSIMAVGMLSLVVQPYSYKFLWAPLMERFGIRGLGRWRGWIAVTQVGLVAGIFWISYFSPIEHPLWMAMFAVGIAFLSASQDIVIDAYRLELLPEQERGLGVAWAVLGYRLAILVGGAFALVMAQYIGWQLTYQIMAGAMFVGVIANFYAPNIEVRLDPNQLSFSFYTTMVMPFASFLKRPHSSLFILFILLYKLGTAFTSSTSGVLIPFLIQGLGFSLATVGVVNKVGGLVAMILGSFVAGFFMLRMSLFRALLYFGITQAVANIFFIVLAFSGKSVSLLWWAILADNFSAGMGIAALLALMMSLCDKNFIATQFAVLSAVSMLPFMLSGPLAAWVASTWGWGSLYIGAFLASLPALFLLYYGLQRPITECSSHGRGVIG